MIRTHNLPQIEFDRVLTLIALEAKSLPGKRAIEQRAPLPTIEQCEEAQARLAEMVRFYHREGLLPLSGLDDVAPLFSRETVLDLDESWIVVRAARATQAVRETFLRSEGYPLLRTLSESIPDLSDLVSRTGKFFTRDGKLREDASTELRAIRNRIHGKRAAIQKTLTDLMGRSADAIQDAVIVMRGDRYCVPVRSDSRTAVPGILHERSGSGASFFIEPMQTVEMNNDLADLLMQEREEIARITRFVSQIIMDAAFTIVDAVGVCSEFDALQASALFSDAVEATRPAFSTDRELRIVAGRHPLIDERLAATRAETFGERPSGHNIVPLTIALNPEKSALVISGPNAGGKTVALKTAGLLVAMGMSGLPVPAGDGTVLPCVDTIHVLIGDDQSVLEHLSTFSAYLLRLRRVLERVTPQSLVLLDELGSGTDPEEGAALAASVIEHLLGSGALLIATTHLSALKTFAVNDGRIVNASMEFDPATGQSTYRMIAGVPGRSRAIDVAQMMGLPSSVIQAARERLGEGYGEADQLLSELQKKMTEVLAERDAAEKLKGDLERERVRLMIATEKMEAEKAKVGTKFRDELERLRDDVSRQVAAEIKALREADRNARASLNPNAVLQTITKSVDRAMEFLPVEERTVQVGEKAEHRKFKIIGKVESISGDKAVLDMNGRKMTVDVHDLSPVAGAKPQPQPQQKQRGASPKAQPKGDETVVVSAELNLIGSRVDDALDESDKFIDRALLEGKQAVRIIHGYGTGTLRKAIREHLRKHPAVQSWRPGDDNEGGDGATVAVLG